MFDFLKNFTKSEEEKRQEAFSAYLDNTLSQSQHREFEARLAEDADLRAEMELAQLLRQQMSEMPRRSVPRSFTLDASKYGVPRKEPLVQAYPFLRAATVMTAFFFVLALGLSVFTMQSGGDMASVAQTAMEPAPAFDAPMAEAEIMADEAAESLPAEKVAETIITETEIVVEEAAAEEEAAEMPAGALPLATAPALAENAAEMADAAAPAEEAESDSLREAPAGAAASDFASTLTPVPTATVSALPRLDVTETAVPRVMEPTSIPDEIANAVDGETAVTEAEPLSAASPSRSLSTSQMLLIGLGVLLLVLVVVTLLARRKI